MGFALTEHVVHGDPARNGRVLFRLCPFVGVVVVWGFVGMADHCAERRSERVPGTDYGASGLNDITMARGEELE